MNSLPKKPKVDVLVPVYGGLDETRVAIESVSVTIDPSWARLVVINDCSPEPLINKWLVDNQSRLGYTLLENECNLGFVKSVNRALRLNPAADVLLLNSDVEVANDWLARLCYTAYLDSSVGSVTATSNNATICSFPVFCEDNELALGLDVGTIDRSFSRHIPAGKAVEIPTGVGFCMYMRREAIDAVGVFDEEAFGRGYGEENDWCQRAIQAGFRNLHALNVFVYHKGAVSFADESNGRQQANFKKVNQLHPSYAGDVHRFIQRDPAAQWRIRAMVGLLGDQPLPVVVAISHGMGGGVDTHIRELISYCRRLVFIRLEPVGEGVVRLLFAPERKQGPRLDFNIPAQLDELMTILRACSVSHVHFHHTMGLPTELWDLPEMVGATIDYTLHDFWVINGNPTLTDEKGIYAGEGKVRDESCSRHYPLPEGLTPEEWRYRQLALMGKARYLIGPSQDTVRRVANELEFSHLKNWVVAPHPDNQTLADRADDTKVSKEGKMKVAILGAISREKGADMLEAVADRLEDAPIEFHLIGYAYRNLSASVITHGPYPDHECVQRLRVLEADVVWFPALWPETYSYTLSAAFNARLPVVVPKLGAFTERVAGRRGAFVVEDYINIDFFVDFWQRVQANPTQIVQAVAPTVDLSYERHTRFYESEYTEGLQKYSVQAGTFDNDIIRYLFECTRFSEKDEGRRKRLLRILFNLRGHPLVGRFAGFVPYSWQRRVKRFLSRQPLHYLD